MPHPNLAYRACSHVDPSRDKVQDEQCSLWLPLQSAFLVAAHCTVPLLTSRVSMKTRDCCNRATWLVWGVQEPLQAKNDLWFPQFLCKLFLPDFSLHAVV